MFTVSRFALVWTVRNENGATKYRSERLFSTLPQAKAAARHYAKRAKTSILVVELDPSLAAEVI